MASLVGGTTSSNSAATILLLKTEADIAFAQQAAAEKAVSSFTDHIKNNQTPENLGELKTLLSKAHEATSLATELRSKVNSAELAYYNPNNLAREGSSAYLANKQVAELNLEGSLGYFPE